MSKLYFAYGSNMKRSRLEGRTGMVIDRGIATLKDYCIAFNKQSKDKSGKANIILAERQDVLGVLYELSEEQMKKLDSYEKGYVRVSMLVDMSGEMIEVQTYTAEEDEINEDLFPTAEYLDYLIDGAKDHNFPEKYQILLKSFKVVSEA